MAVWQAVSTGFYFRPNPYLDLDINSISFIINFNTPG